MKEVTLGSTRIVRAVSIAVAVSTSASMVGTGALAADPNAAAPAPVCRDTPPGPVAGATHPNDGIPDPEGRIAFGQITRIDDGQIVSIYAIDPDGSDLALLVDCDAALPAWSPDGSRLAFGIAMDDGSWQVATVASDGSDLRILTSGPGFNEIPDWAPDGTWLVYDTSAPSMDPTDPTFRTTIWRIDADGSGARPIGDPRTLDGEPRLSPDGTEVLFTRQYFDKDWNLEADWPLRPVIRDIASGEERLLLPEERTGSHPAWSPDGRSVVYNTDDGTAGSRVERMPADDPTAAPEILGRDSSTYAAYKPSYSPDGARIVFGCITRQPGDDGMCLMDADGSKIMVLRDVPGVEENHFSWGPAAP